MGLQAKRDPPPLDQRSLAALVPCAREHGCPLGVDVPAIAAALRAADHARAYHVARASNPFASSCGHGCHAPCESACRRRRLGSPVAIAALEAHASGFATPASVSPAGSITSAHDARAVAALLGLDPIDAVRAPRSGHRVAIIGGGAAGLACAHDLVLLGHQPVVFDSGAEPGGLLTRALPSFRFPVIAARAECAFILATGVAFKGGVRVDAGSLERLRADGFAATFIAVGAWAAAGGGARAEVPSDHPQVTDALQLLTEHLRPAGRVVVVGDGDLALDAARAVLHRGRDSHQGAPVSADLVLPTALEDSIAAPAALGAAMRDGVAAHARCTLVGVHTVDGRIAAVRLSRDGGHTFKWLGCDHLVLATPRCPEVAAFADAVALDAGGFVAADPETLRTSQSGVWAGGACAFGHRSVAHAVADGKRAARDIHAALTGVRLSVTLAPAWTVDDSPTPGARAIVRARRRILPLASDQPADPFVSHTRSDQDDVGEEAARCLDCARLPSVGESCVACGKCVNVCPTHALSLTPDGPAPIAVDEELCIRCGACAERCPEHAITMVRAVWEERLVVIQRAATVPEPVGVHE